MRVSLLLSGIQALLMLAATSSISLRTAAQDEEPAHWVQYYQSLKLKGNWSLASDFGIRSLNEFADWNFTQFRTGINYKIPNSNFGMQAGFWFSRNWQTNNNEYRPHMQVTHKFKFWKVKVNSRLRIESRYFYNERTDKESATLRPRFNVTMNLPLKKNADGKDQIWYGFENEIFIHPLSSNKANLFDQYRLINSLNVLLTKTIDLGINYNANFTRFERDDESAGIQANPVIWTKIRHRIGAE